MVALLWADGNRDAAIRLEELWNELGKVASLCAVLRLSDRGIRRREPHGAVQRHLLLPFARDSRPRATPTSIAPTSGFAPSACCSKRRNRWKPRSSIETKSKRRCPSASASWPISSRTRPKAFTKSAPDGTILWANRADYELLGYAPDEYVGHSITEFHADADVIADMLGPPAARRNAEELPGSPALQRTARSSTC